MKIQDIRTIARRFNIKSGGQSKADLIRTLQQHEGNFDCYGSARNGECSQAGCLWRADCLVTSRQ